MPPEHPQAVAMNKFSELVSKYTDNRVKVKVFHSASLGSDDKMLQATQTGTQEIYYGAFAAIAGGVKELGIFDFPFLFENMKEVDTVMNGRMGQKIFEKMAPLNLVGLGWTEAGFRNLTNSKRPIKTAADIEGLKLRVMPNKVALDTWKALGANPTPMAFSEIFTALEIKAIDGQENPLILIFTNKFHEVNKFITITNHVYTPCGIVVNKKFWDRIKPEDQQAMRTAALESLKFHRNLMDEANKDVVGKLQAAGAKVETLPPEEVKKLREKTKPVIDTYTKIIGEDFVKEFYAEIDKARAGK
nr:TRAP transporter substrate-binding protein [Propionivibrio soli]